MEDIKMKKKRLLQCVKKRFLALLLAVTLAVPNVNMSVHASEKGIETTKAADYDETLVAELQNLCQNGEDAVQILDTLRNYGLVDETGMPKTKGTFLVNGTEMTEEELIEEAERHKDGEVQIDGIETTWEELNTLLSVKKSIQELTDFMDTGVKIDDSNREEYQASLESLQAQLMSGTMDMYADSANCTFGAGVNHQARVIVTAEKNTLHETGSLQKVLVNVSLVTEQSVPVSFSYRTVSGSGTAYGDGTITIPAGENSAEFTVTYKGNSEKRNGKRMFYIQCYDISNALFQDGESNGKSITLPVTISKSDSFNFTHEVVNNGVISSDKTKVTCHESAGDFPIENNEIVHTISYNDIRPYLNIWEDNIYTLIFGGTANLKIKCDYKDGIVYHYWRHYESWNNGTKTKDEIKATACSESKYCKEETISYSNYQTCIESLGRIRIMPDAQWKFTSIISFNKDALGSKYPKKSYVNYVDGRILKLRIEEVHERVNLTSLSIPDGTFYAGQDVPITATFDEKVKIDNTIKLKLADGSVLTPVETGTTGASCTFLYTVPMMPSGTIPAITEFRFDGTKSCDGRTAVIPGQANTVFDLTKLMTEYPGKVVKLNENCILQTYKDASFTDISCEIDDNRPTEQWVTEVLRIDQSDNGAFRTWIQSNCAEISGLDWKDREEVRTGIEVQKALANTSYAIFADSTKYQITEYVKSMYLSLDGGTTRIPLYVVAQLGDTTETNEIAVALVAQYKPEINLLDEERQDTIELFMDPDIGSTVNYLKEEKDAELVFSQTSRGIAVPQSYLVKPVVFDYAGAATIDYATENPFLSNWSNIVDDSEKLVSYHLGYDQDVTHVATSDKENPTYYESTEEETEHASSNRKDGKKDRILTLREESEEGAGDAITTTQYEMEDALVTKGFRVEGDELSLTAKFVDENFSFYGTDNLIWVSSDESVATVKYPEEYIGENASSYGADHTATIQIVPTGKTGCAYFTLYALNNGVKGFTPVEVCRSVTLFCEPGIKPFLKIPSAKEEQTVLSCRQKESLDVCFSSNLTVRNAEEARNLDIIGKYKMEEYPTIFTMEVFLADFAGKPMGEAVYTDTIVSTEMKTAGKMTIPKGVLEKTSSGTEAKYVVTISGESLYAEAADNSLMPKKEVMTAAAGICVIPNPPSVRLGKLESYSILDTGRLAISYEMKTNGATPAATSLTVTDSEGTEVFSQPLKGTKKVVTWRPEQVKGQLKKTYVVSASVQARSGDIPSTDSYIIYVYNHNALDILVDAVGGKNEQGKTDRNAVTLDNHSKVEKLLSNDGKTIPLDGEEVSLAGLMQDVNLSSMISINYGDYVWGQISDQIKWEVSDSTLKDTSTATTVNYEQGGAYSNLNSYNYVSYAPSTNFMAVGLENGETVITATQARTGMKSSITVTSKTLKDQLYLFKFVPELKTKVEYTNGDGDKCTVESNENGELALYEPNGIASDVNLYSEDAENIYIGTIARKNLVSGEQDISKLQNYPVNNYLLRSISNADLYIIDENGRPFANKTLWIRGGVYKNEEYCYTAKFGVERNHLEDGKQDQTFTTDSSGKITVYFDSSQFYTMEEETIVDRDVNVGDRICYIFEIKFNSDEELKNAEKAYEPQLVRVNTDVDPYCVTENCSATIQARVVKSGVKSAVINGQTFSQYERKTNYLVSEDNVYGDNTAVGISYQYPKAVLKTETLLWGEKVETEPLMYTDGYGVEISYGNCTAKMNASKYQVFYEDTYGYRPLSQSSEVAYYPFVDMPVVESTWTMKKSEIDPWVKNKEKKSLVAVVNCENVPIKEIANTFVCSNTSDMDPVLDKDVKNAEQNALEAASSKLDLGGMLDNLNDGAIKPALSLVSRLKGDIGVPLDFILSPTDNPNIFHAVVRIGETSAGLEEEWDAGKAEKGMQGNSNVSKGKTSNGGEYTSKHQDNSGGKDEDSSENNESSFKRQIGPVEVNMSGYFMCNLIYIEKAHIWTVVFVGGGFSTDFGVDKKWYNNFMVGPVPATVSFKVSVLGAIDVGAAVSYCGDNMGNDFLIGAGITLAFDVFAGVGFDLGILAFKLGVLGTLSAANQFATLFAMDWGTNGNEKGVTIKVGDSMGISGSLGFLMEAKILMFTYKKTFASKQWDIIGKEFGEYKTIEEYWAQVTESRGRDIEAVSLAEGLMLYSIEDNSIEERNYLNEFERGWQGGTVEEPALYGQHTLKAVQTNAYSFAEPVYNDDGSLIAYLSDSDSSEIEDTLASFAKLENGRYINMHGIDPVTYLTDELNNETGAAGADGYLDPIYDEEGKVINKYRTTKRSGYGDSTLRIAGTKEFSVACWVREKAELNKEAGEKTTNQDLSAMLNGSEIYTSIWDGDNWNTVQFTDNVSPDMSPAVSVNEKYAIVAWRGVSSSDSENPMNFDVCDKVYARIYNKEKAVWGDLITLYNGQTGAVNGLQADIMEDGTAIAAYVIKTSDDDTISTDMEIMYTVVNSDGTVGQSVRVTNDECCDQNLQLTTLNWNDGEHFLLGWYNESDPQGVSTKENETVESDIRMLAISSNGLPSSNFIESLRSTGAEGITRSFRFSKPAKEATLEDLSILWVETHKEDSKTEESPENKYVPNDIYTLSAVRFYQDGNAIGVTDPVEMVSMGEGDSIDSFASYSDKDTIHTVLQSTHYEIDKNDPSTYTVNEVNQVVGIDENGKEETETLMVYTPIGVTNMYTAVGKYTLCDIEVTEPVVDMDNVMAGITVPVQFTIKNTGMKEINKINITLGGSSKEFEVSILPGKCTVQTVYYQIPNDSIQDVNYTVAAYSQGISSKEEKGSGIIRINLPEIVLSELAITKEESKTRAIQMRIGNAGRIPLENSNKKVVVGLYDQNPNKISLSDEDDEVEPIKTVTVSDKESLALMDANAYTYQGTLDDAELTKMIESQFTEKELQESENEIPTRGVMLYARVWLEEKDGTMLTESDTYDNQGTVIIQSLVDKYQSQTNVSTRMKKTEEGIDMIVTIQNNSYGNTINGNVIAVLKNQNGDIISKVKQSYDKTKENNGIINVGEESVQEVTIHFTEEDLLDGYSMKEAVAGFASYSKVDDSALEAKLSSLQIKGQQVAVDLFDTESDKIVPVVANKKMEVKNDGKKETREVEVSKKTYHLNKTLNTDQLDTLLSAAPENAGDRVKISVNQEVIAQGQGAQIANVKLDKKNNVINVCVSGDMYPMMEITREVPVTDSKGKTKITADTERYFINQNGNPVNEGLEEIDLTAEEIVSSKVIYLQNISEYIVTLSRISSDFSEIGSAGQENEKAGYLLLKAQTTKNTSKLTWNQIKNADGYLVYGAKCDTAKKSYKVKLLKNIKDGSKLTYTQKNLKINQWYKYFVVAYKMVDGKRVELARSYVVRAYTASKASKYANPTKVTVKKTTVSVKAGKTSQITATLVLPKGKKKKKQGPELRYLSSDESIATVTSSGKIKGKKKGNCYIYIIAQNGVYKKVKVTIK